MYKQFLSIIFISISLLFAGCGGGQDNAGSDSAVGVQYVRQIVAEDNKTARTIMWQSEVRQDYSVEYRLSSAAKSGSEQKASA